MNRMFLWFLRSEPGRRVELQILANLVSSSLGLPRQKLLRLPSRQSLDVFAELTAEHLGRCSHEQQQTLHRKSIRLGRRLRSCLSKRDDDSVTKLIFQLYLNIGISMEGHFPGKITVNRCHFCKHYSPEICSMASLMDSGVICGVMGGGQLTFTDRLTEGKPNCLCELTGNNQ